MNSARELDLAYDLLPGYGFFAPQGSLRLRVDVKQKLKRVSIFFDAGKTKVFDFPSINLFGRDRKEIPKAGLIASAAASSLSLNLKPNDVLGRVISGQGFRSGQELRPELTIVFKEPVALSHIMLGNRPGVTGKQARHICVNGYSKGRMALSFRNTTPKKMVAEMHAIHTKLGLELPQKGQSLKLHCDDVREVVNASLDDGEMEWSARQLGQFLPLFEEAPEATPFRKRLMGEVIARQLGKRSAISTRGLAPLGVMLNTPARLEAAVAIANEVLSRKLGRDVQMIAGKHAFQESRLVLQKDEYLRGLDQIFPAMQACGVTPMLAYGTLLGAVREGGFLAHDDDVDLLYFDGSKTRAEAMGRRMDLVEALGAHGFKLVHEFRNANFHVTNGETKLDLFPCWKVGRKLHVMQRYPEYMTMPVSAVLPVGQVRMYDRTYPAPADPAAFLKWRYGAGWSTPDPYHEWPWQMAGA